MPVDKGGDRDDSAVIPYAAIPFSVIRRVAKVCIEGEKRYGVDNWKKGLSYRSTFNHLMEHLVKYIAGDTSEDQLAKVMWGIMALMYYDDHRSLRVQFDDLHPKRKRDKTTPPPTPRVRP